MTIGYCVRRAGDPPPEPGTVGVDDAPVRLVEAGGCGMWVSEGDAAAATLDRIAAHDAVARHALRTATPLPLRFGTRFPDEAAVRAALLEHEERWKESLRRVAGRVEVAVHVRRPEPAAPTDTPTPAAIRSGREYLESRRAAMWRDQEERDLCRRLVEEVERHFAELRLESAAEEAAKNGECRVAHLVARADLSAYRLCVERARAAHPELEIALSGPWAPYSFVRPA